MIAGQKLDRFIIEKEIGAGAMGTVFRATDTKSGEKVAFKFISTGLDTSPKAMARFEREMAILKTLHHPNIVQLKATGTYRSKPFYAMEYIDGESLEDMLQRRGRLDWEEVVRLGQQVCAALYHAHDRGIIHRDLKPANIMITKDGTLKLTDFGIAKGLDAQQLTATNCAIGTASYMSPEQCKGEKNLSHKSDLYSLGVMLYEMLVGRRPFQAENTLEMYLAHVEGTFERPTRIVLDIPIWLDTLVCQLMEKQPDKRPFDASVVSKALADIKEKVETRRSAGVDVATGRTPGRRLRDATEEDREAAKLLKQATRRKKKSAKAPFTESQAFKAITYGGGILAIIAVFWWSMQPPAADKLYLRAYELMSSKNTDDHEKARAGPINDYFRHYPDRTDKYAQQMRAWADSIDVGQRDRQLRNRVRLKRTPDNAVEDRAQSALKHEDEGNTAAAREDWQTVEKHKTDADPEMHVWGMLAVQKLQMLDDVDAKLLRLGQRLEQARQQGMDMPLESEAERLPALALYYELFGDYVTALAEWTPLKSRTQNETDERFTYLMAAKKVRELKKEQLRDRPLVVKGRIDEAQVLAATDQQKAKMICRDIIILYDKASEVQSQVAEARALLQKLMAGK